MSKKYYHKQSKGTNSRIRNLTLISVVLISLMFYLCNHIFERSLLDFISKNLVIQTLFLFGALLSFVTPFVKLLFVKELTDEQIIKLIEEQKKKEEELAEIKKQATIG